MKTHNLVVAAIRTVRVHVVEPLPRAGRPAGDEIPQICGNTSFVENPVPIVIAG